MLWPFFLLLFIQILELADSYIKISGGLVQLAHNDNGRLDKYLSRVSDSFEKVRVSEIVFP